MIDLLLHPPRPDAGGTVVKAGKVPPRLAGESDAEGEPAPVTPKVIAKALRTSEGRGTREPPERGHPSPLPISRTFPSPTETVPTKR